MARILHLLMNRITNQMIHTHFEQHLHIWIMIIYEASLYSFISEPYVEFIGQIRPKRNTIEIEKGHVRSCQSMRWLQATDAQLPYLHNYGDAVGSEWSCKSTAVVVQLRRSSAEEQAEYLCDISWYFNCIVLITVKRSGDPFQTLDYHLHQGFMAIEYI